MNIELLLEAERRGILPPDKAALLGEARRRGLVPEAGGQTPQAAPVAQKQPQTNIVEQAGSGVNEGLASAFGAPVDAMTWLLNKGSQGINAVTGYDLGQIENPVGGSESLRGGLSPFISDVAPQSAGQRYARRVGQEVGYGVPAAVAATAVPAIGPAARANFPAYMGASVASDVGAGIGGQTAREIAPESDTLDFIMSMGGGMGTAAGISAGSKSRPKAPTLDDVDRRARDAYQRAEQSGVQLTDAGRQGVVDRLGTVTAENRAGNPNLYPRTNEVLGDVSRRPPMSLWDAEELRRQIGNDIAGDPSEARVGVALKQELDDYLRTIQPNEVRGGNAAEAVADLAEGRAASHTSRKAREVMQAEARGESRAATTGTGGNVLNAQSQNVRRIYDNETDLLKSGRRSGYTPDELEAMRRIVFPSRSQRALRTVGRLSPGTGGLMAAANTAASGGGVAGALATGNPYALLATAPGAAGMIAQGLAEGSKKKALRELVDTILRGGVAAPKTPNQGARAAIAAQLLSQTDAGQR